MYNRWVIDFTPLGCANVRAVCPWLRSVNRKLSPFFGWGDDLVKCYTVWFEGFLEKDFELEVQVDIWLLSFDFDNIFVCNKYSERKSKWITSLAIERSVQMYCKQIRFGAGVKSNKRLKDIGAVGPIHSLAGRTRACYITQHSASQNCLVRLFVQN